MENPFLQIENRLIVIQDLLNTVLSKEKEPIACENTPQRLYSLKELAEFLGWSIQKVQREKNRGTFPYIQNGRKCIFVVNDVLAALSTKKGVKK